MKYLMVLLLVLIPMGAFAQVIVPVEQYAGHQWEVLERIDPGLKLVLVQGVLAGISAVRDYAFDIDPKLYEHYSAYETFLQENGVALKIVEVLDRYYEINRGTYKYDDRIVSMILVIYGKYWWRAGKDGS